MWSIYSVDCLPRIISVPILRSVGVRQLDKEDENYGQGRKTEDSFRNKKFRVGIVIEGSREEGVQRVCVHDRGGIGVQWDMPYNTK